MQRGGRLTSFGRNAWQVLHSERSLYNARGGWDLARFLADPEKEDVEEHLANLRCGPYGPYFCRIVTPPQPAFCR